MPGKEGEGRAHKHHSWQNGTWNATWRPPMLPLFSSPPKRFKNNMHALVPPRGGWEVALSSGIRHPDHKPQWANPWFATCVGVRRILPNPNNPRVPGSGASAKSKSNAPKLWGEEDAHKCIRHQTTKFPMMTPDQNISRGVGYQRKVKAKPCWPPGGVTGQRPKVEQQNDGGGTPG